MSKSVDLLKQAMTKTATIARPEEEQLSSAGEKSNNEGKALDEYLAASGDAKSHTKNILKDLFEHGKSGQYETRQRTLIEKVAQVIKK